MSRHIRLSTYEKPGSDPKIVTSCVATVSNYCWFERMKDKTGKTIRCTDEDFDISFKLSSTSFTTSEKTIDGYHFDRNGVKLTYNQCYLLFRSEKFTCEYLDKVSKYFERDQDLKQIPQQVNGSADDYESEVEEEDPPSSQITKDSTIRHSVIKRLKKL
jgi:hypothetical protein